jgi:3-oxoacyl-[acyl-carrier protein] reductase
VKKDGKEKIALVVGGSRGIGRAIALRLVRSGFDIWLTYRGNHTAAQEVKEEIEGAALEERAEEHPPEVVVFNAGITRDNLMIWMTREEWDAVLSTNLDGFYNVIRSVLFSMLRVKRGRIVTVSSASGQTGHPGQVNYSASKSGLIGASKALAREVGKRNIIVNVVAPGMIETDMTEAVPKDQIIPLIPLQRIGNTDDVASVVDFLCSEEHMYIHGQVIGINGGLVI